MVAEVPFWAAAMFAPKGACEVTLGRIVECPPPVSLVIVLAVLTFFVTAYAAFRLGLGD